MSANPVEGGVRMGRGGRIAIVTSIIAIAAGLAVWVAMAFLGSSPPTVDFASGHQQGAPVNLNVQTVGATGLEPHPDWVSYLTQSPSGQWEHTTLWQVPAHTLINVTIYQYDSGSPLRNQQIGQVEGTVGGTASITPWGRNQLSNVTVHYRVFNSNAGNGVAHTFSIPTLGISVPLIGVNGNLNLCGNAPCTASQPHNVIKFSFRTPGPGNYPWQCFVPCGLGFLYGNGGPMSTIGYMGGFLEVVS